jgi:transketolase
VILVSVVPEKRHADISRSRTLLQARTNRLFVSPFLLIGVNGFGASAPGPVVMAEYGFTVERVVATAKAVLGRQCH